MFQQVALFAKNKFKLTYFLSQNVETFHSMFVLQECNQPVGNIVTMDDLYNQITHVVDTVRTFFVLLVFMSHLDEVSSIVPVLY